MTDVSDVVLTDEEMAKLRDWVKAKLLPALQEGAWFEGRMHSTVHHFKVKRLADPRITVEQYFAQFPPANGL